MSKEIKLKKGIRKGTIIKDLYDDGNYYYKINKVWYPTDFNNFKHPKFISRTKPNQLKAN